MKRDDLIMERFLRYSLENNKKIKVIFLKEEKMEQQNIRILGLEQGAFIYTSARQKKPKSLPYEALLCAGYARGDHGEGEGEECNVSKAKKTMGKKGSAG